MLYYLCTKLFGNILWNLAVQGYYKHNGKMKKGTYIKQYKGHQKNKDKYVYI